MSKFITKKTLFWLALNIIIIALVATPFRAASYFIPVILLAIYLPKNHLLNSLLFRVAFSFVVFTCILQAFGILLWLTGTNFTLLTAVVLELVIVNYLLLKNRERQFSKIMDRSDYVAASVAIVSLFVVLFGIFGRGPLLQQALRFTTTGFDNTTHVSMTLSVYDNNGFIYGSSDTVTKKIVYKDFTSYPQGWHLSNSLMWHSLSNNLDTSSSQISKVLVLYIGTILLWYCLIIFIFTKLLLLLLSRLSNGMTSKFATVSAVIFTLFLQLYFFSNFLLNGFGSFLPILLYSLVMLYVIADYLESRAKRVINNHHLLYGALLLCGVVFSWLLAAPVIALPLLILFLDMINYRLRETFKWIKSNIFTSVITIVLASLCFVQLFLQILYSEKSGQLNESGGITDINYMLMFGFMLILIFFAQKIPYDRITRSFIFMLPGSMILTGFIYAYQLHTAGHASYYSTKVGYITFMLMCLFAVVVLINELDNATRNEKLFTKLIFMLTLVTVFPFAANIDSLSSKYIIGEHRKLSPYSASQISDLLGKNEAQKANLVVFKELDYEEDLISTHFIKMLSRKDPECQRVLVWYMLSGQREKTISQIESCSVDQKFYVITSGKNYSELHNLYKDNNNIEVILSN